MYPGPTIQPSPSECPLRESFISLSFAFAVSSFALTSPESCQLPNPQVATLAAVGSQAPLVRKILRFA